MASTIPTVDKDPVWDKEFVDSLRLKKGEKWSDYGIGGPSKGATMQTLYEMSDEQFDQLSAKEIKHYLRSAGIHNDEFTKKVISKLRRKEGWRNYLTHLIQRLLRSIRQS